MLAGDLLGSGQSSDRRGNPRHPSPAPPRQRQAVDCAIEQRARITAAGRVARIEPFSGCDDSLPHGKRALAGAVRELARARPGHGHDEVEAVKERVGELRPEARQLLRRARALGGRVRAPTAGAEIHGGDEPEASGKRRLARSTRDADRPVLERLPESLEHQALEFRELVEQQNAVMGKARLARAWASPATDDRRHRRAVVRGAKGRLLDQCAGAIQNASDGMNSRDLERRIAAERRQDAWEPPRKHRLARPGRTCQQEVVAAGGGQFKRAAGTLLSAYIGQIRRSHAKSIAVRRDIRWRPTSAAEICHGLGQVAERDWLDSRQSRLRRRLRRAEDALEADAPCSLGDSQDAADGAEPPIKCELADDGVRAQRRCLDLPGGSENRQRD